MTEMYLIKQRIMGIIMIVLGIISAVVLDGDVTACMIVVPLGIWLMVTKKCVGDYTNEIDEDEEEELES